MFFHIINDEGIYEIYQDGKVVMTIELDKDLEQVIIKTNKEVYQGPIDFINFSGDTWQQ